MSDSNYHSPEELICNVKSHDWSSPQKDSWMAYHGDNNFYYHKCDRCSIEVKHVEKNCPSCISRGEACTGDDEEDHSCPYQSDVNNDSDSLCNCCSFCEGQCAMDI